MKPLQKVFLAILIIAVALILHQMQQMVFFGFSNLFTTIHPSHISDLPSDCSRYDGNSSLNGDNALTMQIPASSVLTCVSTFSDEQSGSHFEPILNTFFQSWENFSIPDSHLLIVDDHSTPSYQNFIIKLQQQNPSRVFAVLKAKNGGISRSKNSCIRYFLEHKYEYLFLADHDIQFLQAGWQSKYIQATRCGGVHHLSFYLDNRPEFVKPYKTILISFTPAVNGPLLYLSRKAVAILGGFRVLPHKWGHEHTDVSGRARKAGLCPYWVDIAQSERYVRLQSGKSVFSGKHKEKMYQENEEFLRLHSNGVNLRSVHVPIIE